MNRIKSRLWVEALLRRCLGEGKFGAIVKAGADEAGAVIVAVNHLDGRYTLLVPPPGPSHNAAGERIFARAAATDWPSINVWFEKQRKFDGDLWLVEIEDRNSLAELNVIENE